MKKGHLFKSMNFKQFIKKVYSQKKLKIDSGKDIPVYEFDKIILTDRKEFKKFPKTPNPIIIKDGFF